MASEPLNPYAPTDALAHGTTADAKAEAAPSHEPSRFGAFVVAILAQPIAGAGFYLLRRPRRFVGWTAAGLLVRVLLIVAARAALPKLCAIAVALTFLTGLASIADTAFADQSRGFNRKALATLAGTGFRVGDSVGVSGRARGVSHGRPPVAHLLPSQTLPRTAREPAAPTVGGRTATVT